ncbi:antibiotic biosynthesis monooxygenase [Occallatibacter savannae]|uniref:antibiotic biosynthesis monooxygenase n=1 Tax=Occallatibacter savannae TaxID=1002691 RepID=UPI000D6914F4|nr:antibiotic biosynthesis monooxygenase [Occallatibacter savannae]
MIARIWRGSTRPEDADAYASMLKPELLPGISKAPGYRGSYLMRRNLDGEVEFITILIWESIEALKAVTGANYTASIIPEERLKYLLRHDSHASHYEIESMHGLVGLTC